jgi:hypothetical protein
MVKVSVDQIVDVITVRDRIVAAARAVRVLRVVRAASMARRARGRVGVAHPERVLVDVVAVHVVEVTVMQVVLVTLVLDGPMAAVGAMRVVVSCVCIVTGHLFPEMQSPFRLPL